MSRRRPPPPELTPAQRALFESEPRLAEEAAAAALKGMGAARFRYLSREEMVSIAAVGAMEAAASFDPARGASYRTWAFFAAVHAVLDGGREEHQRHAKARAMVRASVMTYFANASARIEIGVDTDASIEGKLHGLTNPLGALAMLAVAASKPAAGGEDDVVELEAAALAGDALRDALPAPGSEERRMLDLCFVERMPLTEIASAMGVEARGYRTFVRRFHEVVEAVREQLARRGIREMPPWREEVSGQALGGGG